MKKYVFGLGIVGLLALSVPFISFATTPVQPTCTYTATPSSIINGVPTQISLHYTDSGANWFEGTLFGGGIGAYGTSGSQFVTISGAARYELFAIDLSTGNAHYCVASISSLSHTQRN